MIEARRLLAVGAILAVAAILTCTDVWGEPGRDKELKKWRAGDGKVITPAKDGDEEDAPDEVGENRFAKVAAVLYQPDKGDGYVALPIRPKLPDAAARPKDYLVIVDTSASKAMGPLAVAQQITEQLVKKLGADDRLAVMTANVKPRDLSHGFKSGKDLDDVIKELFKEMPLGAVNLKKTLNEALASFEVKASRQRAILFLGDGKSVADPLDSSDRADLCAQMVKKQVAFFAVPLGERIDAKNLHSLISGTGGKTIRYGIGEKVADTLEKEKLVKEGLVSRLVKEIAEPILYDVEFTLPDSVKEVLPSKMPPLRRDSSTLVIGKLKRGTKALAYKLSGNVSGKAFRGDAEVSVPASDNEHIFLVGVHNQWKKAKDRPALLPADRALGYAHKQNQLALEDLLAKAEMALEKENLVVAEKLFEQARNFAPHSIRVKGGLTLVEKMKSGRKSRADMLKELAMNKARHKVMRLEKGKKPREIEVLADGDEKEDKEDRKPGDVDGGDPLADVKRRREVAKQQAEALVTEAIRQANRLVRVNPDDAYALLKRTLDGIKGNADLQGPTITALAARLSQSMGSVARVGNTIKRDQTQALALRAAADARLDLRRVETLAQDRVRERMRIFHNLMDQAREEEAHRQALAIRNDLISQGQAVPPVVTYATQQSLNGYHLREIQELRRVREERFLATLLEVERSHVPFPDEPPVEFPSAAMVRKITRGQFDNWIDFSKYRTGKYSVSSFSADTPARLFELQNLMNKTVDFAGLDDPKTTLIEALDQLAKVHRITFDVNEKAFKYEMLMDVLKTEIANPNPIPPMKTTLGTVLRKILARISVPSGATYLIRRDVVEITTGQFATAEKAVRVYPVADLVTPIPSAFNQQAVTQAGSILGALGQMGLAAGGGLAIGALGIMGGGLMIGGGLMFGGGLMMGGLMFGGLMMGGLMMGGFPMMGMMGGLMMGGMLMMGGPMVGQFNFMGNQNLGQGGLMGFPGGQQGQLGNLGGQFGIQGGNTSQILITLIRQVVGRPKDWAIQYNPITGQPLNPLDDEKSDSGGLNQDNNNLGYYPPSLALVVKAPSTIHTQASNLVISLAGAGAGGGMVAAPGGGEGRILVDGRRAPRIVDVAGDGDERDPKKKKKLDAKEIWQEALAKGVDQPGLIIATADYLALNQKFDHAAEFLKANLRQGVVVKPWVYQSLAIALRESGGSADEIERAEVSAADLQPLDGHGYLQAARALAQDKNYERALAFCRQAAELEPGLPYAYADAARYAEMAKDAQAMQWAAGHLLSQDWPNRNDQLQVDATQRLESLAKRLGKAEGQRLLKAVLVQKRRDLVVKLLWQGEADLDLKVEEPSGSFCTAAQKQSVGGGIMIADSLSDMTSETYVAAEGFSGDYRVQVERIWGKPLGNKAQLKIIRHQGSPDETEELITVRLKSSISAPIVVPLSNGRRTQTAFVPPPALMQSDDTSVAVGSGDEAVNKLRALADPEVTGVERGIRGGVAGQTRPARPVRMNTKANENDRTLYQNRVQSFVANSVDVTAQAVLSADRRSVRLSLTPVFNTGAADKPARVVSPVFPGAPDKP